MRISIYALLLAMILSGCCGVPGENVRGANYEDPRSLTHIDEVKKLKVGMHESEVVKILGQPFDRETGFYGGTRLWFRLYNPKYETIPTNFLISTDRNGNVTFISSGG